MKGDELKRRLTDDDEPNENVETELHAAGEEEKAKKRWPPRG